MPILNLKVQDTQKVYVKPDQITVTYTATTYNFIGSGATSVVVDDRDVTIYTNPSGVDIIGSGSTEVTFSGATFTIFSPTVTIPTNVSEFNNDAGYITINDVPTIPSNVSEFNNDAGYITISDLPAEKTLIGSGATTVTTSGTTVTIYTPTGGTGANTWVEITEKPSWLSGTTLQDFETGHTHSYLNLDNLPTLFSGSYNDLTNKPSLGSIAGFDLWQGTQAQYDALGTYDSMTLYLIEE